MRKTIITFALVGALILPAAPAHAGFFDGVASFFGGIADRFEQFANRLTGAEEPLPVGCTMDAKICPDGSSVGRVGPSCEFAACPDVNPDPVMPTPEPPVISDPLPVFCTMDAKICPDGSSVGRVGPSCEFAACPGDPGDPTEPVLPPPPVYEPVDYSLEEVISVVLHAEVAYERYIITLEGGIVVEVRTDPTYTDEQFMAAFVDSGFDGSLADLLALVQKANEVTEQPIAPVITDVIIEDMTVTLVIAASRIEAITPCGPIFFAQVHWGSEASEDVMGLGCSGERQTLSAKHTFTKAGKHTIYVSDQYGNQTEETIQVGTVVPYTIDDVLSVEIQNVDPIVGAIDDEYTRYTITVESGAVHTTRVYGNATYDMNAQSLYDTGYSGKPDLIWQFNE